MKKFCFVFALVLISPFIMAEGIGITTGIGFGISGINRPDGRDPVSGLKASVSYGNTFLNNTLRGYVEAEYDIAFIDSKPMGLNIEAKLEYTLMFSGDSGMVFLVQDENYLRLSPAPSNLWGAVRPGIIYGMRTGWGLFFAEVDVPITYNTVEGQNSMVYLDVLFKWISTFGLGLSVKVSNYIYGSDWLEKGYQGLTIYASYGYELVSVEAELEVPKNIGTGMVFIPKVGVSIPPVPGLSAYIECNISRIGNESNLDIIVSPVIGVTYSF